jgi:hypothetical protein
MTAIVVRGSGRESIGMAAQAALDSGSIVMTAIVVRGSGS